jgi:hypothetical protein
MLIEQPFSSSPVWLHLKISYESFFHDLAKARSCVQFVASEDGILVCPSNLQFDEAEQPICSTFVKAVMTKNQSVIHSATKEKALSLWPECARFF